MPSQAVIKLISDIETSSAAKTLGQFRENG